MKTLTLCLSSKEILDKVFSSSPRGYSPLEVDAYLDKILSDYRLVENNVLLEKTEQDMKDKKISELQEKIKALEIENSKLNSIVSGISPSQGVTTDNIKLLKRIDALERYINKLGYNAKSIR